jgi:hypothetical protein
MQNHLTFSCFACILPFQRRLERYPLSTRLRVLKMVHKAYPFLAKDLFLPTALCLLLLAMLVSGCNFNSDTNQGAQKQTFTSTTHQTISYNSNPHDIILRTFYGGALAGTLELAPRISLYGDGTYVLGLDRRGQLSSDKLQSLLSTLVDSDGLLSLSKQQFFDLPNQNATYLELTLNNKTYELVYGIFGTQPESQSALNEYHRLGGALQEINNQLNGEPTSPYTTGDYALLARQVSYVDRTQTIPYWPLPDLTLYHVATFECGTVPEDTTSSNKEIACLKFTIPLNAVLLTADQYTALKTQLPLAKTEVFSEGGFYYEVTIRPLLPDEKQQQQLAMFGSGQLTYKGVPLQIGPIPQSTPTPQG